MKRERVIRFGEPRDRLRKLLAFDVEQRHAPAVGEKAPGGCKPDAARGAGHEGDFREGGGH
jgi:hypothetical protein